MVCENSFQCLLNNSSVISDVIVAICTIIATVLAVITYKKAKATILQSEVAKQQTTLLIEILNMFSGEDRTIFMQKIYHDIMICNLYEYCGQYGCEVTPYPLNECDVEEIPDFEKLRAGYIILKENAVIAFNDVFQPELNSENNSENEEKDFQLDVLYVTKDYQNMYFKLKAYAENPFMPEIFVPIFKELIDQIEHNLKKPFARVFETNFPIIMRQTEHDVIWQQALLNEFNHQKDKKDHTQLIDKMIKQMREYLNIK